MVHHSNDSSAIWRRARPRLVPHIATLFVALIAVPLALAMAFAQATFERIQRPAAEPQNWLSYSGGPMSQRYSPLTDITAGNVRNLELKWVYQVQSLEKFEATPLVVDGVMYTVQAPNDIVALDAATGRVFWVYAY